jgi:hypothetical protein
MGPDQHPDRGTLQIAGLAPVTAGLPVTIGGPDRLRLAMRAR